MTIEQAIAYTMMFDRKLDLRKVLRLLTLFPETTPDPGPDPQPEYKEPYVDVAIVEYTYL